LTYSAGGSPPAKPTCTAPNPLATGVELASSAFSGDGSHASSDWEVRTTGDELVASSYDDTTNKTSITLSGLTAETNYKARVRHTNEYGDSDWSDYVEFATEALVAKPDVTIDQITRTSARATGTAYDGDAEHDKSDWECRKWMGANENDLIDSSYDDAVNLTQWTVTGLTAATHYYIRVRYHDENGWGEWSNTDQNGEDDGRFKTRGSAGPKPTPKPTGGAAAVIFQFLWHGR